MKFRNREMVLFDAREQAWFYRTKRELIMPADGYLDYIELPGSDIPATKKFYGSVFG
jgi:hypothetical protein